MYQISVWIHILMAAIWVGGLIYTAAVVVPFAAGRGGEERQRILRGLARRFRWVGWGAVTIAVLTGLANLTLRLSPIRIGQLISGEAFDPNKVDGFIAAWLPWKLLLVANMIFLMLFHDITSIRAAKHRQGSPDRAPSNHLGTIAASIAALLAIAVLYVSVRLVRG